ncbi:hypothetical protein CLV63_102291 [Murinocardiopsis flavida]|uniref:Uncharacterized protein n=1 Tax=Murinocardiopsis flavida TaxID=645275 RepID=A0A2P8DSH1_9ACTN|nr:hypothetical protein [Murinocardiopsis flavida]PSL00164.1 hypothetical protein CLV63_102291 [Murinocardiopsis flavida]
MNTNKRRAAAGAVAGALGGAAAYFTTQQLQTLLAATGGASAADPGTGLLMTALRLLLAASAAFLLLWWMGVPGAALGAPFALLLQLAVEAVVVPSVVSWVSASWFALVLDYIRPEGPVVFVVLLAAVMAIAVPAGAMAVDRERSPAAR